MLAKSLAVLASSDEHTNLSQVMSKLAEVQDNLQQIIEEQGDSDFFTFSELLKDYLSQISAVKVPVYYTIFYYTSSAVKSSLHGWFKLEQAKKVFYRHIKKKKKLAYNTFFFT